MSVYEMIKDDRRTEGNLKCLCIPGNVWSQLGRPTASDWDWGSEAVGKRRRGSCLRDFLCIAPTYPICPVPILLNKERRQRSWRVQTLFDGQKETVHHRNTQTIRNKTDSCLTAHSNSSSAARSPLGEGAGCMIYQCRLASQSDALSGWAGFHAHHGYRTTHLSQSNMEFWHPWTTCDRWLHAKRKTRRCHKSSLFMCSW